MSPALIAGIALTMVAVAALVVLRRAGARDNVVYGRELDAPSVFAGRRRPNGRMLVVVVLLIIVGGVAGFLSASGPHH